MVGKVVKWAASFLRLLGWKIRLGKRLVLPAGGKTPYIGKGCILRANGSGRILLGSGVYLSEYVTLDAIGGTIEIGDSTFLNTFCRIVSMDRVSVGNKCMMGSNVSIYDHDHDISKGVRHSGKSFCKQPVCVADHVWLCTNVVLTRGSHVGENCVVGANAVVNGTLEPHGVYAGVPAVKKRTIQAGSGE